MQPKLLTVISGEITSGRLLGLNTIRKLKGEREERILNGTSTAFVNLLSGHRYQISVDVSTCSKNVSTSLTVQTGISSAIFSFSISKLTHSWPEHEALLH